MYVCHFCKQISSPHIPATLTSIKTRARSYPPRPNANLVSRNGRKAHTDDPGGSGQEIVQEALACPACATALAQLPQGAIKQIGATK
jgi:hypothetical protein